MDLQFIFASFFLILRWWREKRGVTNRRKNTRSRKHDRGWGYGVHFGGGGVLRKGVVHYLEINWLEINILKSYVVT